jgi:hypothetical protein
MTFGTSISLVAGSIAATATEIPRIREGNYSSEFLKKDSDEDVIVQVAHTSEKNTGLDRHLMKVKLAKHGTAAVPAHPIEAYLVLRARPDDTEADLLKVGKALVGLMTDANIKKLYGKQS